MYSLMKKFECSNEPKNSLKIDVTKINKKHCSITEVFIDLLDLCQLVNANISQR